MFGKLLSRSLYKTQALQRNNTMVSRSFRACVVSQPSKGVSSHEIVEVTSAAELPQPLSGKDDLSVVKVEWSTLNYKDGLVLEGQPG